MRLITIPLSHYCEKARWALEYCGIEYIEDRHLQMIHRRYTRRVGATNTVPVLVTSSGDVLPDSTDIVEFADQQSTNGARLYPDDIRAEVKELERDFSDDFGVETRRWAYHYLLPNKKMLVRYNNYGAPRWERALLQVMYRFARRKLIKHLDVTQASVDRGRESIDRAFDAVVERLGDGRPYLTGDRFTAADLTFAALSGPILFPREYGVPMPTVDQLPAGMRDEVRARRAHPAGAFALKMFAEQRPTPLHLQS